MRQSVSVVPRGRRYFELRDGSLAWHHDRAAASSRAPLGLLQLHGCVVEEVAADGGGGGGGSSRRSGGGAVHELLLVSPRQV